tara:strand:+ start:575 stop:787 length:213 start_codon:yes stop_codon:yes gene_type:complete
MMINKFASPNKDLVVKPTNCKQCKKALTEENRVRKSGHIGYSSICRICRNKNNLKYSRKRYATIRNNPLW